MEFTKEEYKAAEVVAKKQALTTQHSEDLEQELLLWACENYVYVNSLREKNNLGKLYKALTYQAYRINLETTKVENPILSTYNREALRTEIGKYLVEDEYSEVDSLVDSYPAPEAIKEYYTTDKSVRTISKEKLIPRNTLARYLTRVEAVYLLSYYSQERTILNSGPHI